MYFPFLCRDIVKELPKEESELFFALVGYQVDVFKIGPLTDDILGRIKYEAAIIGFTHWLAENRAKVLTDILSFWVKILLWVTDFQVNRWGLTSGDRENLILYWYLTLLLQAIKPVVTDPCFFRKLKEARWMMYYLHFITQIKE